MITIANALLPKTVYIDSISKSDVSKMIRILPTLDGKIAVVNPTPYSITVDGESIPPFTMKKFDHVNSVNGVTLEDPTVKLYIPTTITPDMIKSPDESNSTTNMVNTTIKLAIPIAKEIPEIQHIYLTVNGQDVEIPKSTTDNLLYYLFSNLYNNFNGGQLPIVGAYQESLHSDMIVITLATFIPSDQVTQVKIVTSDKTYTIKLGKDIVALSGISALSLPPLDDYTPEFLEII